MAAVNDDPSATAETFFVFATRANEGAQNEDPPAVGVGLWARSIGLPGGPHKNKQIGAQGAAARSAGVRDERCRAGSEARKERGRIRRDPGPCLVVAEAATTALPQELDHAEGCSSNVTLSLPKSRESPSSCGCPLPSTRELHNASPPSSNSS